MSTIQRFFTRIVPRAWAESLLCLLIVGIARLFW